MPIFLVEAQAWIGSGVETLRYATQTFVTRAQDFPANTTYDGRILDAGAFERSLFQSGAVIGRGSVGYGSIELNNADGELDPLFGYGFDGRQFVIKMIADGGSIATAETLLTGTLKGVDSSDPFRVVRLRVRERLADLQTPLLTARYAGTTTAGGQGTATGNADLKDQLIPAVYGKALNVTPKVTNPFDLVYQVAGNAVQSIAVFDGGVAIAYHQDYPTVAALLAATFPSSATSNYYATCLAEGSFRLDDAPVFALTADVIEGTERSCARIAQRILLAAGVSAADIDAASFDALHTAAPAEAGVFVDGEDDTFEVASRVLESVGAALTVTAEGDFKVVRPVAPSGTEVAELTIRDLLDGNGSFQLAAGPGDEGDGVPAWSVVLSYGKLWTAVQVGDLDRALSVERRALLTAGSDRKATAQDASVKTPHPKAVEITGDTLLVDQADALAEAQRRLALYSTRRDYLAFPVPDNGPEIDLGDVVRVTIPRFGWDAGKLFTVLGTRRDFTRRTITYDLWG